ncbi:MAG: carbonic anhydrase [Planctomycetota bacterium]
MRRSTHDPKPSLPPLLAWQFLERNNRLYAEHGVRRAKPAAAPHSDEHGSGHGHADGHANGHADGHESGGRRHQVRAPSMLPRPAGAGRYVCAIVTCADVATDLPAAFGLDARDVLMLKIPGPFVNAETAAMLERAIVRHRLSLVLVLGHAQCEALRASPGPASDALDRRVAALQQRRRRRAASSSERGLDLTALLVRRQRELLLASSERMQRLAREDHLRIVPGHIDARTARITWQHRRAEALPLAPVR